MGSTTWLNFLLLAIVSSMLLPQTDLPLFYQVTILNWLVAYWQNMIFEVLHASNFYVQHAPISLAEVVKSCLVSLRQIWIAVPQMEVLVHVFLLETSNYLLYYYIHFSWWNSWNPWKESTFFFIENLLKFTYSNVEKIGRASCRERVCMLV